MTSVQDKIRTTTTARTSQCRVCAGEVAEFVDFGRQPLSDAFLDPAASGDEFFYELVVGRCGDCEMVQLLNEVPRDAMFHQDYPYFSSGSTVMREHFEGLARAVIERTGDQDDPFVVEIGSNDGVMLKTIAAAGIRHLGVEPSGGVAEVSRAGGVQVLTDFFELRTAEQVRAKHGPASVIFAANTFCHIPYVDSVLAGVVALLADDGVFVFEDPYLGDIVAKNSFDQIYDEHFFFFCATTVARMAERHGLQLVDVERLPVHGGEVRYTLAHPGAHLVTSRVTDLLQVEADQDLLSPATLEAFADRVHVIRDDLRELLTTLRSEGKRVVAYGATAKSATVANFCGLGPDDIDFVVDTTPAKQNRLTPGSHIPVRDHAAFSTPYPDYALLFAWNHAAEIKRKESAFVDGGGRWIEYVPAVHTS